MDDELLDIFMAYALAMHDAQLLELSLAAVNTLWGDSMHSIAMAGSDRIADVEAQGEHTFGLLVGRFRTRVGGATIYPLLEDALRRRNRLAHTFFRERFGTMNDAAVRKEMLAELNETRAAFDRVNSILDGSIERWLLETGAAGASVEDGS